jgi:hypothetical protein
METTYSDYNAIEGHDEAADGMRVVGRLPPEADTLTYLSRDVGRYDTQQQLLLLLLLALQFHSRLDAGACPHESVVVSGFRHVSVVEPGASSAQQEHRLGACL